MSDGTAAVTLSEWQTLSPANCAELRGRFLDNSSGTRRLVDTLNASRMLRIRELKDGLEIGATSYVGRIRIGNLNISVIPKLRTSSLSRLLRYAFGFRSLELAPMSMQLIDHGGFEDILISQLLAEVNELIARGLQRSYVQQDERRASPRGRIDIQRLAFDGGAVTATLPCRHFSRIEDTLLNQVLLAGLGLAGTMAHRLTLRREARRLASLLEEQVTRIQLDATVIERADRHLSRLTTAYVPSMSIIQLLVEAKGIVFEGPSHPTRLPGFLFDMNRFFQSLLSRFMRENLTEYTIHDEHGLKRMMRYNPLFNPQRKQAPTPRPDYAVMRGCEVLALLDAKYRDLLENPLPREMLYQLVVYAISERQHRRSSILYPTTNLSAKEARIDVTDPVYGDAIGQVCLRPVHLDRMESLIAAKTAAARREREAYARWLAFGIT